MPSYRHHLSFNTNLSNPLSILLILILSILILSVPTSSQCTNGTSGCKYCLDSYTCLDCLQGYFLGHYIVDVCWPCDPGCQICTNSATCTTCYDGFTLVSGACNCNIGRGWDQWDYTVCQFCAVAECTRCDYNYTNCTACADGYGLVVDAVTLDGTCQACTVANCIKCSASPSSCTACADLYGLSANTCTTSCSVSNCLRCPTSPSTCTYCNTGYYLSSGTCAACSIINVNCIACSGRYSVCSKCSTGYGIRAWGYGYTRTCIACQIANCQDCSTNYKVCTTCASGYNLTSNGECKGSGVTLAKCLNEFLPDCLYCQQSYGASLGGLCAACTDPLCQKCPANNAKCTQCSTNYGVDTVTGNCASCHEAGCISCPMNANQCQQCNSSLAIDANARTCNACTKANCDVCRTIYGCLTCSQGYGNIPDLYHCTACSDPFCKLCTTTYTVCETCLADLGYGLLGGICVTCQQLNCYRCQPNANKCTKCIDYYGINSMQDCVNCADANCRKCETDYTTCTQCVDGYGVNPSTSECVACPSHCITCTITLTLSYTCTSCDIGYGLNSGSCVACVVPHCLQCYSSNAMCTRCATSYGLNGWILCLACSQAHCQICSLAYNVCETCISPYGVNAGTCVSCDSNCLTCHPSDYYVCLTCPPYTYLNDTRCDGCSAYCSSCQNSTYCYTCESGYYVGNTTYACEICVSPCASCQLLVNGTIVCLSCQSGYTYNSVTMACMQVCGDGITLVYACDLPKGVQYDGCNDDCTVQSNFNCMVDSGTHRSVCSYNQSIGLKFVKMVREYDQDQFQIILQMAPPLYVFNLISVASVFVSGDTSYSFSQVSYDESTHYLTCSGPFYSDMNQISTFIINFTSSTAISEQFYATPSVSLSLSSVTFTGYLGYYYTEVTLKVGKVAHYVSYIVVVLGYIGVVLGLIFKRLAGIQGMLVIQYAYFTLVWLNAYLYAPLQMLKPLQYSMVFAHNFIKQTTTQQQFTGNAPFLYQFGESQVYFFNNYNITAILQGICIVVAVAFLIKMRKIVIEYDPIDYKQKNQKPQQLLQMQIQYDVTQQVLLTITILGLINFVSCAAILFKSGQILNPVGNIISLSFSFLINFFVMLKFWLKPDPFAYFRYSFRYTLKSFVNQLTFKHMFILLAFVITSQILIIAFSTVSILSIIPLAILFLYTIIYHPYLEPKQNIRSCFNIFVMMILSSFRIYLQFSKPPIHNSIAMIIWVLFVYTILLLVTVGVNIFSIGYNFYYVKYLKPQIEEEDIDALMKKQRNKVYEMLDNFNIKTEVVNVDDFSNVFKRVGRPTKSLLDYSNQLNEAVNLSAQKALLQGKMSLNDVLKGNRKLHETANDRNDSNDAIQEQNEEDGSESDYNQKNKRNDVKKDWKQKKIQRPERVQKVDPKQQEKIKKLEGMARMALIQENQFINLKAGNIFMFQALDSKPQKMQRDFIQAYEQIDENHQ